MTQDADSLPDYRLIIEDFFELIKIGKFKDVLQYCSPECITHNPYVTGNMDVLTDAMIAATKDMAGDVSEPSFSVNHIFVDGNFGVAYTQLLNSKSNPAEGGLRQVHIFHFEWDKIVEYWDITQQITASMPNAAGAF